MDHFDVADCSKAIARSAALPQLPNGVNITSDLIKGRGKAGRLNRHTLLNLSLRNGVCPTRAAMRLLDRFEPLVLPERNRPRPTRPRGLQPPTTSLAGRRPLSRRQRT